MSYITNPSKFTVRIEGDDSCVYTVEDENCLLAVEQAVGKYMMDVYGEEADVCDHFEYHEWLETSPNTFVTNNDCIPDGREEDDSEMLTATIINVEYGSLKEES